MISIAIQLLLLASALLVNFVVPAAYGLEAYGAFIQANILVFLTQKLSDLMTEPLISRVPAGSVYPVSLLISAFAWLTFIFFDILFEIGSITLLGAMLLSSCSMLSMHALGLRRNLLVFLLVFLAVFICLMSATRTGFYILDISDILFWTNVIPAVGSSVVLLRNGVLIPNFPELKYLSKDIIRIAPENFLLSLVFNLYTNLLPYIFSKTLPLADLGLFRVMTALVQSATTIFPINTKTLFVALVNSGDKDGQIKALLVWSSIYFAFIGLGAAGIAITQTQLLPYIALVASLPTLFWTVMLERYLQAVGFRRPLIAINLVVGAAVLAGAAFVHTVEMATSFYAIGLALYAISLLFINRSILPLFGFSLLVLVSPVVVLLQSSSMLYPVAYFAIIILIMGTIFRPGRDDFRKIRANL